MQRMRWSWAELQATPMPVVREVIADAADEAKRTKR
jgi:hypothetical protein